MSKGRKKIRHRKTINGGAGQEEEQQTPEVTSKTEYEHIRDSLIRSLGSNRSIQTEYRLYINSIESAENLSENYSDLLKKISEKHKVLLDEYERRKGILALTENQQKKSLTFPEKQILKKIIEDFFKPKEDVGIDKPQRIKFLSFKKNCTSSKYSIFGLGTDCRENIIKRIQSFLTQLRDLLSEQDNAKSSLPTMLTPDYFSGKLQQLETVKEFKDLTFKNIQSAVNFLCGEKNESYEELSDDDKKLVDAMKLLFPKERSIELDKYQQNVIYTAKQKAAVDTQNSTSNTKLPDVIDELVSKIKKQGRRDILNIVIPLMNSYIINTTSYEDLLTSLNRYLYELPQGGGSQSVRRNKRKTKKEIKNKYKRSKKHHHRTKRHTKRHMKRHRKTKRHMKRHRNTKRY